MMRRQHATRIGWMATFTGLAICVGLGWFGASALTNSTSGQNVAAQAAAPKRQFAYTPTALVGVTNAAGRLTSAAILAVDPSGAGGSIIGLSASADVGAGLGATLRPLNAVVAQGGLSGLQTGAEGLTNLSYDAAVLVNPTQFAALIAPLQRFDVTLPTVATIAPPASDPKTGDSETGDPGTSSSSTSTTTITTTTTSTTTPDETTQTGTTPSNTADVDGATGAEETVERQVNSAKLAALLTRTDDSVPDWYLDQSRQAVWQAIVATIGEGVGTVPPLVATDLAARPSTVEEITARLFAGPVTFRALGLMTIDPDVVDVRLEPTMYDVFGADVPLSVVEHDRAETVMMVSAAAPGRVGAPADAPTYRLVADFSEATVAADYRLKLSDLTKSAVDELFAMGVNVSSVAVGATSSVPARTRVEVASDDLVPAIRSAVGDRFGPVDFGVAEHPIEGIDVEITLGTSYLDYQVNSSSATTIIWQDATTSTG